MVPLQHQVLTANCDIGTIQRQGTELSREFPMSQNLRNPPEHSRLRETSCIQFDNATGSLYRIISVKADYRHMMTASSQPQRKVRVVFAASTAIVNITR
jgi:hypothetical protein